MRRTINAHDALIISAKQILKFITRFSLSDNLYLGEEQIELIHKRLLSEIRQFQLRLKQQKFSKIKILSASYCLVSCLDEFIMNSPIANTHNWSKRSLLAITHNETWGGENFYKILNYALQSPMAFLDLINLIRLLLHLGYRGKYYRLDNHGDQWLEAIAWPEPLQLIPPSDPKQFTFIITRQVNDKTKLLSKLVRQVFIVVTFTIICSLSLYDYQLNKHSKILLEALVNEEHPPV